MIEAITLSLEGVVLDVESALQIGVTDVIRLNRWDVDPNELGEAWGRRLHNEMASPQFRKLSELMDITLNETAQKLGLGRRHPRDLDIFYRGLGSSRVYPDVIPAIQELRSRFGVKVGLVCNWDDATLPPLIGEAAGVFDSVVTSERVYHYKPNPVPFVYAFATLGVEPTHSLHVGVSVAEDLMPMSVLGGQAVQLSRGGILETGEGFPMVADLMGLVSYVEERITTEDRTATWQGNEENNWRKRLAGIWPRAISVTEGSRA